MITVDSQQETAAGSATTRHNDLAVLIPFYGRREALEMTLASLQEEHFPHDVIVVDDGNAISVEGCEIWHASVTVLRLDSNCGVTIALNNGLKYAIDAGYRLIARLDAGDRHVAGRLQKQVEFLNEHPECQLVGGQARYVGGDGRHFFTTKFSCGPTEIYRDLHRRCCFVHPAVMFRVEVIHQVGYYREEYAAAEDYDLFFRIAERFPTANLPEVLLDYEVDPRSISAQRRKQAISKLRILAKHFRFDMKESYYGLAASALAILLPRRAVIQVYCIMHYLVRERVTNKREIPL